MQKNNDVFFSIIIPTYNRENQISSAILSVIEQEYENWELLIVDDGSTDNTKKIVSSFLDNRIKYFYKKNEERSRARNFGIDKAQGDYICFLDSDDVFFDNHLLTLFNSISENKKPIAIFQTGITISGNNLEEVGNWFFGLTNSEVLKRIFQDKPLYIQGICLHKKILESNNFPPQFVYGEDQHLWIRILVQYEFISVSEVTACWLIHTDNSVVKNFESLSLGRIKKQLAWIHSVKQDKAVKASTLIDICDIENLKYLKVKKYLPLLRAQEGIMKKVLFSAICFRYLSFKHFKKILLGLK